MSSPGELGRTAFGDYVTPGTMRTTGATHLTGRMSLISTWKTPESSRQFYDARQSQQLDAKLRVPGLGPAMLQHLAAGDLGGDHTGLCSKQCLLQTALLHFGVLLTPGELECLKAEWQVMDHATGNVDYKAFCRLATPDYLGGTPTGSEAPEQ
mmetsp:Transcript_25588/g.75631  ORF Transcript_25588/g.75631 Transcript_25588/m.75631 type:complete len:153 (-) Transcript_25588:722-1180(-)